MTAAERKALRAQITDCEHLVSRLKARLEVSPTRHKAESLGHSAKSRDPQRDCTRALQGLAAISKRLAEMRSQLEG